MRVVVTGASGNVGTALLRRLDGAGHEVVGVSRRRPPEVDPYREVRWVTADLADAGSARLRLDDAMRGADAVVHLAWMIQPSHDRELMRRTNQNGTRIVAEAARTAGVGHLVHMSSIGAYGPSAPGTRVDESWPTDGVPTSRYSVDKVAAEQLLDEFADAFVLTRVRPTLILQEDAAGEIARYFLGHFVPTSVLRRPVLRLAPWPKPLALQFVHADDVASAIKLILEQCVGGAFNVAAEPVIDRAGYRRIFGGVGPDLAPRALRVLADLTWRMHLQPTDPGWLDLALALPLLDTGRLRSLGWQPQHSAEQTLVDFVAALAQRRGAAQPLLQPRRVLPHHHAGTTTTAE